MIIFHSLTGHLCELDTDLMWGQTSGMFTVIHLGSQQLEIWFGYLLKKKWLLPQTHHSDLHMFVSTCTTSTCCSSLAIPAVNQYINQNNWPNAFSEVGCLKVCLTVCISLERPVRSRCLQQPHSWLALYSSWKRKIKKPLSVSTTCCEWLYRSCVHSNLQYMRRTKQIWFNTRKRPRHRDFEGPIIYFFIVIVIMIFACKQSKAHMSYTISCGPHSSIMFLIFCFPTHSQ